MLEYCLSTLHLWKFTHIFFQQLKVEVGAPRRVILIFKPVYSLGDCWLHLGPLVPFVERSHWDQLHISIQCRLKRLAEIFPIKTFSRCLHIPWPNASVHVAWTNTRYKEKIVFGSKRCHVFPVWPGASLCEPIRGKVRVETIKAGCQKPAFIFRSQIEAEENAVILGAAQTVLPSRLQSLCPQSWVNLVRVVNVKHRKLLPTNLPSVKAWVLSIWVKDVLHVLV